MFMPPVRCTDMNMWRNHCLGYGLIICISIWKFHTNLLQSHPFLYPSLTMSRVSALSSNSSFLWNTLDKAPRFPPPALFFPIILSSPYPPQTSSLPSHATQPFHPAAAALPPCAYSANSPATRIPRRTASPWRWSHLVPLCAWIYR